MRIVVNRIESARVERARPPDDAVDLVTLRQQQLRQIRAVLAGNTRDQRFVRHDLPAGDLKSSLTMASPESKHQKPSSKHQRNPKFQPPNRGPRFELGTWSLELLWSLVFGVWSFDWPPGPPLSLSLSPLLRRWEREKTLLASRSSCCRFSR